MLWRHLGWAGLGTTLGRSEQRLGMDWVHAGVEKGVEPQFYDFMGEGSLFGEEEGFRFGLG